jgi:hypothetical protein
MQEVAGSSLVAPPFFRAKIRFLQHGRTSAAALSVINKAVAQPPTKTNSPRIGSNNLAASVSS